MRKVRDAARAAREREERAAERSPAERDAHARWQRAHKPGPPEPRAAARERRRQNEAARELLNSTPASIGGALDHDAVALAGQIADMRRRVAMIEIEDAVSREEGLFA